MTRSVSLLCACLVMLSMFWASTWPAYAQEIRTKSPDSEYEERVNWLLHQGKDVLGEEAIASGGATYDKVKDKLRPLFYSTGFETSDIVPHTLLFCLDGGEPPCVIPVADGSRIYSDSVRSPHYIDFNVGPKGDERYGFVLSKLEGPVLEDGYYPIMRTSYRDSAGLKYTQESFALSPAPGRDVAAYIKLTVNQNKSAQRSATLRVRLPVFDLVADGQRIVAGDKAYLIFSGAPRFDWERHSVELTYSLDVSDGRDKSIYLVWFPQPEKYSGAPINADSYEQAKRACKAYWDAKLQKGSGVEVPEPVVMHATKNLLVQNLILRHRYGLGAVAYHRDWYPREGADALTTLGLFGYTEEYKDGLEYMFAKPWREREFGNSATQGEYLSHAAHYFFLTRDQAFLQRNTPTFDAYCATMKEQVEKDPNGLLFKQKRTADIPTPGYWLNEQAVSWRGLRDMASAWKLTGRNDLYQKYAPVAEKLRLALLKAVNASKVTLPDGSLFVPLDLYQGDSPYLPITETRVGSYWNLTFPYAMASGLWDPKGEEMGSIVKYMHDHGALILGLLRFNLYPVPIGSYRQGGATGYETSGIDNVYLLGYLQLMADRDEVERLLVSFYGTLAHGMTRNTFMSGEGASIDPHPGYYYRSSFTTPNGTNNAVFLQLFRLMLVNEVLDQNTGLPTGLNVAFATPREWLMDGKEIALKNVPTFVGPLSYRIKSSLGSNRVEANLELPASAEGTSLKLRLRTPGKRQIRSVSVNGEQWKQFDQATETIDLGTRRGRVNVVVTY